MSTTARRRGVTIECFPRIDLNAEQAQREAGMLRWFGAGTLPWDSWWAHIRYEPKHMLFWPTDFYAPPVGTRFFDDGMWFEHLGQGRLRKVG